VQICGKEADFLRKKGEYISIGLRGNQIIFTAGKITATFKISETSEALTDLIKTVFIIVPLS
jgi:hypothetical protein